MIAAAARYLEPVPTPSTICAKPRPTAVTLPAVVVAVALAVVLSPVVVTAAATRRRTPSSVSWRGLVGEPRAPVADTASGDRRARAPSVAQRNAPRGTRPRGRSARDVAGVRGPAAGDRRSPRAGIPRAAATSHYARASNGFSRPRPRAPSRCRARCRGRRRLPGAPRYPAGVATTLSVAAFGAGERARPGAELPGYTARASPSRCSTPASTRPTRTSRPGRCRASTSSTNDDATRGGDPDRPSASGTAPRSPASSSAPAAPAGWMASRRARRCCRSGSPAGSRQPTAATLVYARSDQLIAGLDRAVDPNGDGDAHDAVRVALVGVAEPYAAFTDGPEARAVQGALDLNTLVVAPAGNDGGAGPSFGSVAGPAGGAVRSPSAPPIRGRSCRACGSYCAAGST